jgi:gluconate 2-dehydrogenase gamma chain
MRRRQFLTLTVSSAGGLLVYSLAGLPVPGAAQTQTVRVPLRFFTEDEALDAGAAAARIFPSDESGPGAQEAGVVVFIDRQLAGPYGRDARRYTQEPFVDATPEFGYQGKATPREVYREGLKTITGLHRLSPDEQDAKLREIERTRFFTLLRTHTIQGMFSDPIHGGNVGLAGWEQLGFPGPRMSNRQEVDQYYGRAFRPKPISLEQATGKRVRPAEEEEL